LTSDKDGNDDGDGNDDKKMMFSSIMRVHSSVVMVNVLEGMSSNYEE